MSELEDSESEYERMLSPAPTPSMATPRGPLSDHQQQRLREYLDNELTRISRQFIRGISSSPEQHHGYASLSPLLSDVDRLVDLLWYSITSAKTMYGQEYYLLRIADELVDYIQAFPLDEQADEPRSVIRLFEKLDSQLSKLVIGLDSSAGECNTSTKLNQTQAVRLESIAERTRIAAARAFEPIDGYKVELGDIYKKVFDNCG